MHSRKHGPFDSRYPPIRHNPAPASLWRLGDERLDWQGFLARFFPGSRRHDFDVLAAYESYRNHAESHLAGGATGPALAGSSSAAHAARLEAAQSKDDEEEPLATADTDRWESDGGASAARPRSSTAAVTCAPSATGKQSPATQLPCAGRARGTSRRAAVLTK